MEPKLPRAGFEPILGALSKGPMTGYDIHKMFAEALAFFWQEGFARIYPTLKSLEESGLIERVPGRATTSTRKRIVYRHTPAGRELFRSWLHQPSAPRATKNEVLLKLFFAGEDLDAAIEQIALYLEQSRRRLERLLQIQNAVKEKAPLIDLLVLKQGVYSATADVQWAEEAHTTLQRAQTLTTRPNVGGAFLPADRKKRSIDVAQ